MHINFKEKDIEDFIWDSLRTSSLGSRGLPMQNGYVFRQLEIPGAGIMDIVTISIQKIIHSGGSSKSLLVEVFELKRDAITCSNVGQIARYINAISENEEFILNSFDLPSDEYHIVVNGILIGNGIDRDARHLLSRAPFVQCYEYSFDIGKGIRFKPADLSYPIIDIDAPKIDSPSFRELSRASYPIVKDWRPRVNADSAGESQSDTGELLPF